MSHSKKDAKGGHRGKPRGWDCWSKRPGAGMISGVSNSRDKQIAHKLERADVKRETRRVIIEEAP